MVKPFSNDGCLTPPFGRDQTPAAVPAIPPNGAGLLPKQTVLLVDADLKSARVLEVSLRKAGYSVTLVKSALEALEAIDIATPDLVLSDTRLAAPPSPPKEGGDVPIDGYQLCRRMKDDPVWLAIPFIFLTSSSSIEDKIRGLELGVEDYLTKPIYIKEILTRIQLVLAKKRREGMEGRGSRASFTGLLSEMGPIDLLSTIDLGRKSGVLEIEGASKGTIWFRDGRVVDAKCGNYAGANAVYRMLVWNDGRFEIKFGSCTVDDAIDMSTQGMLMEGMRRLDEWQRLQEQLPPLDTVYEVDSKELATRLGEIPDEVNQILRAFDGNRTLLEVVDASGFDDLGALATLSKLYFEGLIFPRAAQDGTGDDEVDETTAVVPGEPDEGAVPPSASETRGDDAVVPTSAGATASPRATAGDGQAESGEPGGISTAQRAFTPAEGQNAIDGRSGDEDGGEKFTDLIAAHGGEEELEERDVAKQRGKRNRTKREMVQADATSAAQTATATQSAAAREEEPSSKPAATPAPEAPAPTASVEVAPDAAIPEDEAITLMQSRERFEAGANVIQFPKSPPATSAAASAEAATRPGKATVPGLGADDVPAIRSSKQTLPAGTPLPTEVREEIAALVAKKSERPAKPSEKPEARKSEPPPPKSEPAAARGSTPPPPAKERDRKSDAPPAKEDKVGGKRERRISFSGELTDEAKAFFQDRSYESAYKPVHDTFEDLKPEETVDHKKNRRSMILTAGIVGAIVLVVGGIALHNMFFGVHPNPTLENSPSAESTTLGNPEQRAIPNPNAATTTTPPATAATTDGATPATANTNAAATTGDAATTAVNAATPEAGTVAAATDAGAAAPPTTAGTEPPTTAGTPPTTAGTEPPTTAGTPPTTAGTPPTTAGTPPTTAGTPPTTAGTAPAGGSVAELLTAATRARSRGNAAAATAYQAWVDAGGADASAMASFAYWLANRGDLTRAAEWAGRATTTDATNQMGWYVLGVARMEGAHPDRAAARDALRRCAALPGAHAAECRGAM